MKNALLSQIAAIAPQAGELLICRLGQHSFILKTQVSLIAIDPYLSPEPRRLVPPIIAADEFEGFDLICCTHDHGDHIDRPCLAAMAQASPNALFIVPEAVRKSISEIPQTRLHGMNDGELFFMKDLHIHAVAAAHEFLDRTPEGLYPYLGYVIEGNGRSVYHSGDCCVYEGLQTKLAALHPDIMLLPINGRDAIRLANDCIGNMTYQEAADLAGWLHTPLTIPAHYDMFASNLGNPKDFADYMHVKYPALQTRVLQPGELFLSRLADR